MAQRLIAMFCVVCKIKRIHNYWYDESGWRKTWQTQCGHCGHTTTG